MKFRPVKPMGIIAGESLIGFICARPLHNTFYLDTDNVFSILYVTTQLGLLDLWGSLRGKVPLNFFVPDHNITISILIQPMFSVFYM